MGQPIAAGMCAEAAIRPRIRAAVEPADTQAGVAETRCAMRTATLFSNG